MASITCGNCHLTHDSVEMVRSCYEIQKQDPASVTPSQAEYARASKMLSESAERREMPPRRSGRPRFVIDDDQQRDAMNREVQDRTVEAFRAGLAARPDPAIDHFIKTGKPMSAAGTDRPTNRDGAGMTIPGFYRTGEQIYKVTPAKSSNRTFAHELQESEGAPSWEYVGLANRYVPMFAPKLSLEDAAQYGKTHGYCIICGRQLTAEESVAAGIGPICAGRL